MRILNPARLIVAALMLACVVIGCTPTDPKKRLETTCAESFKLSLKDPDSLVIVANLGNRGVSEDEGKGFWLRYKAKNSYGAFVSSNVYCLISSDGTATRASWYEDFAILRESGSFLKAKIRGMRAGKKSEELDWGDTDVLARHNVLDSADPLLLMNLLYKQRE